MVSDSNIYGGFHFNPRPREEGDPYAVYGTDKGVISIHALVKRATIINQQKYLIQLISIHALVKRATLEG